MRDCLLAVEGVSKSFGGVTAADDLSITFGAGELHAIIGPNGAGKTTLFDLVTGFQTPDSGTIRLDGEDVTGLRPDQLARRGLVRTFQIVAPFEGLTARRNLLAAYTDGLRSTVRVQQSTRERAAELLDLLGLDHVADLEAGDLSGGQQKLLELGRALMLEPRCLLLDEPTAGVDPAIQDRVLDTLREVNAAGTTVVVIEHDMEVVGDLADRVSVLDEGRLVTRGDFETVTADRRVREAYVGREREGGDDDWSETVPPATTGAESDESVPGGAEPVAASTGRPESAGSAVSETPTGAGSDDGAVSRDGSDDGAVSRDGSDDGAATRAAIDDVTASGDRNEGQTRPDGRTGRGPDGEDGSGAGDEPVTAAGPDIESGPPRLHAQDVVAGYGNQIVLDGVSVESRPGVTCIFGPNGSGKSTLLQAVSGRVPVRSGSVAFGDRAITNELPHAIVAAGITTLPQTDRVFAGLSVRENLLLGGTTVGDTDVVADRIDAVLEVFPELEPSLSKKARTLSGGQRVMLGVARAMVTGAEVYLLDEPLSGLAPSMVDTVVDVLDRLVARGTQVVLVEQQVREALPLADHVYVLAQGQIRFDGPPTALRDEDELADLYLGLA